MFYDWTAVNESYKSRLQDAEKKREVAKRVKRNKLIDLGAIFRRENDDEEK